MAQTRQRPQAQAQAPRYEQAQANAQSQAHFYQSTADRSQNGGEGNQHLGANYQFFFGCNFYGGRITRESIAQRSTETIVEVADRTGTGARGTARHSQVFTQVEREVVVPEEPASVPGRGVGRPDEDGVRPSGIRGSRVVDRDTVQTSAYSAESSGGQATDLNDRHAVREDEDGGERINTQHARRNDTVAGEIAEDPIMRIEDEPNLPTNRDATSITVDGGEDHDDEPAGIDDARSSESDASRSGSSGTSEDRSNASSMTTQDTAEPPNESAALASLLTSQSPPAPIYGVHADRAALDGALSLPGGLARVNSRYFYYKPFQIPGTLPYHSRSPSLRRRDPRILFLSNDIKQTSAHLKEWLKSRPKKTRLTRSIEDKTIKIDEPWISQEFQVDNQVRKHFCGTFSVELRIANNAHEYSNLLNAPALRATGRLIVLCFNTNEQPSFDNTVEQWRKAVKPSGAEHPNVILGFSSTNVLSHEANSTQRSVYLRQARDLNADMYIECLHNDPLAMAKLLPFLIGSAIATRQSDVC